MAPVFVPEGHVIYAGALLTLEEAGRLVRPGRYRVTGRLAGGKVSEMELVVGPGGARLGELEEAAR